MNRFYILRNSALFILSFLFVFNTYGQNRALNGIGNNPLHPTWGAVGTSQLDAVPIGFTDGISTPSGIDRPNPRIISNNIFNQDGLLMDQNRLSDYAWVWGQFIDHDITLVVDNPAESHNIVIPMGDVYFDPAHTGTKEMHLSRSMYTPGSGTSTENHRKFPNGITSFIDASTVYGSDLQRANWLRTLSGGKLKTSSGNMLPYNTTTGQIDGDIDPFAPEMAMANPYATNWFIAGDVRANENVLLTSMHTIFMREHNRICEELVDRYPTWLDENIYQMARKMVGAQIQSIVYNEWLPTLGIDLPGYSGYNLNVDPGIMNVFSAAAYRYGHTVISSDIIRLQKNGDIIPQGNIKLRDAYFQPDVLVSGGGVDPLLRGMATQVEQDFDTKMIGDLRNFLFGAPGSGGLDLAAMNIQRGRDRGLPDYNTVRRAFDLPKVESFEKLTSDPFLNNLFRNTYQDIDNIDPWVGFLSEDHMEYSLFGETVMKIVGQQFLNLRDGDRYFYQRDPFISSTNLEFIQSSSLAKIIMRNSEVVALQPNVFLAEDMSVAVSDIEIPSSFDVSPNPSNGDFLITSEYGNEIIKVMVYNSAGRIIATQENPNGKNEVAVSLSRANVSPGLFIVVVQGKQGIQSKKVIIN